VRVGLGRRWRGGGVRRPRRGGAHARAAERERRRRVGVAFFSYRWSQNTGPAGSESGFLFPLPSLSPKFWHWNPGGGGGAGSVRQHNRFRGRHLPHSASATVEGAGYRLCRPPPPFPHVPPDHPRPGPAHLCPPAGGNLGSNWDLQIAVGSAGARKSSARRPPSFFLALRRRALAPRSKPSLITASPPDHDTPRRHGGAHGGARAARGRGRRRCRGEEGRARGAQAR
jgi:hypothetical protein